MYIFGDSIAKGVGVEEGSSWADLLVAEGEEVTNLAADGERVEGTLEKVQQLKLSSAGETVIIATGTNNCGRIEKDGEALEPDIESFEKYFTDLLKSSKEKFVRTIVLGLMPTDGTIMPLGGDAIVSYDNQTIQEFNDALSKLCAEVGIPFVDVLPHFLEREKELLADHIHPNTEGHKIIFDELRKALN